jgi:hypothetical protein
LKKYIKMDGVIKYDILEMEYIKQLRNTIPKLDIMKFMEEFFDKIIESYDIIFIEMSKKDAKSIKKTDFNILRHLTGLQSIIQTEIDALVVKLVSGDKLIDKFTNILSNIGYYKKLYEEYREETDITNFQSDLFRNNKKEESILGNIKYLNDVINQIKNNKLSNPLNKDRIRPQFRDFLNFGNNIKLFKVLGKSSRMIYNFARELKSKHQFKIMFPEMVANLLHYLLILSLNNLYETLDNSNVKTRDAEYVEYRFITDVKDMKNLNDVYPDKALTDYMNDNNIAGINTLNDEIVLDEDGQPIDLIESFEIKNSNNIKMIGVFITTYLEYVWDNQTTYDQLTKTYIKVLNVKEKQKSIETTLRNFEWLNKEGNEERRQLLNIKMKLKKVDYASIDAYLHNEYGNDFITQEHEEFIEGLEKEMEGGMEGGYEGDEIIDENNDMNEMNEEFPDIVAMEDMEDGDMDYGYLGVNEE